MLNLTVSDLKFEDKNVDRVDKQAVVFKSARMDKYFKDINPRLRVDVAVFDKTVNITYWFAGTKVYFRSRYSREFDNKLGTILYATYRNIKTFYAMGMFNHLLENETEVA